MVYRAIPDFAYAFIINMQPRVTLVTVAKRLRNERVSTALTSKSVGRSFSFAERSY